MSMLSWGVLLCAPGRAPNPVFHPLGTYGVCASESFRKSPTEGLGHLSLGVLQDKGMSLPDSTVIKP